MTSIIYQTFIAPFTIYKRIWTSLVRAREGQQPFTGSFEKMKSAALRMCLESCL